MRRRDPDRRMPLGCVAVVVVSVAYLVAVVVVVWLVGR